METTIGLFNRFKQTDVDEQVAHRLGVERSTITVARNKGRFSPAIARKMAVALRLDPNYWEDIAAAETLPEPARSRILKKISAGDFVLCQIRRAIRRMVSIRGSIVTPRTTQS